MRAALHILGFTLNTISYTRICSVLNKLVFVWRAIVLISSGADLWEFELISFSGKEIMNYYHSTAIPFFFCPTEAGSKIAHQTELGQEQWW